MGTLDNEEKLNYIINEKTGLAYDIKNKRQVSI